MQRVMSPASVRLAWTIIEGTASLGKEDREMRGFEVVRETVKWAEILPDSAWAIALVPPYFNQFWQMIACPERCYQNFQCTHLGMLHCESAVNTP